jgi:mannose-6-phosphate isomerase-like protein (cupin superfamily)
MLMRKLDFSCNYSTLSDGRGAIFTFIPPTAIVELTVIQTRAGEYRGYHFHKEFDEYILVLSGHGIYLELDKNQEEPVVCQHFKVGFGDCLHFPVGCAHTLHSLTEMRMVACLSKKWDDCDEPITKIG